MMAYPLRKHAALETSAVGSSQTVPSNQLPPSPPHVSLLSTWFRYMPLLAVCLQRISASHTSVQPSRGENQPSSSSPEDVSVLLPLCAGAVRRSLDANLRGSSPSSVSTLRHLLHGLARIPRLHQVQFLGAETLSVVAPLSSTAFAHQAFFLTLHIPVTWKPCFLIQLSLPVSLRLSTPRRPPRLLS